MAKTIEESMEELRENLVHWREQLKALRAQGARSDVIEEWIRAGELTLERWEGDTED